MIVLSANGVQIKYILKKYNEQLKYCLTWSVSNKMAPVEGRWRLEGEILVWFLAGCLAGISMEHGPRGLNTPGAGVIFN